MHKEEWSLHCVFDRYCNVTYPDYDDEAEDNTDAPNDRRLEECTGDDCANTDEPCTDCDNPTDDNEHWGEPMGGYCECGHGTVEHPTNGECECPMNADGVELFFNHDKMRCEQSMEPECPGWWHE